MDQQPSQLSPVAAGVPPSRGDAPAPTPAEDRAFAAVVASIERLDALGLADARGISRVEPATMFEPAP